LGTLVIGLGNPLRGDDGVGLRVVEHLARRALPEQVTLLDGGAGGLELLHMMEGWDRVVLVDAAELGRESGDVVRFTPDQVQLAETEDRFSLHHAGLAEVLALARALNQALPTIVVFGVQPWRLEWEEGLSPAVEAAVPVLVEAILREVGEEYVQDPDH